MITKQFLESEIKHIEVELEKAKVFVIQAQAVIDSYKMLICKFDEQPLPPLAAEDGYQTVQE